MAKPQGSAAEDPHAAARSGDLKSLQFILSSTPRAVNSRDKHSRTPLHLAAWAGQAEVVSYLCKNKADVGAAAMDDMGAIHFAAQKGHLGIVQTLLSSGVSVKASNRKGFTPLHYAVQGSHFELVRYLLRKGASLAAKTKAGKTPLDLASNEEIRSLLKEWENSVERGQQNDSAKAGGSDEKPSSRGETWNSSVETGNSSLDKPENEGCEVAQNDGEGKRKGEKDDTVGFLEKKRSRVALDHLLTTDDTNEDEEQ